MFKEMNFIQSICFIVQNEADVYSVVKTLEKPRDKKRRSEKIS